MTYLLESSILTFSLGPVCKGIAGPRCVSKGHLVHCEKHDVCHNPRSECAQCKGEAQRAERPPGKPSKSKKRQSRKGGRSNKKPVETPEDEAKDGQEDGDDQ